MKPLVSIVIPVYNGANYLAEAIDSALAQTYKNIEVIVVNDGSPDDGATERIALSYGDKIRYIYQKNGGVSSALNTGIREMRGEYFSWLSHDDLYKSDKIEKQVALIHSKNDIILCSGSLMNENKKNILHHIKTLEGTFTGLQLFDKKNHGYVLNGLGFLVPKHVFDKVGTFDESMRYLQDLDMWLRIMIHDEYRFICQKDLLVITRIHRAQQTNTISDMFDVDRKNLALKHFMLISRDDDIKNKKNLYVLYYKLFVRGNNVQGKNVFEGMLKKEGYSNFRLHCMALPYDISGHLKMVLRFLYNKILQILGVRDL